MDLGSVGTSLTSVLQGFAHVEPWVVEGVLGTQTVGFSRQELGEEVLGLIRDVLPLLALHRVLSDLDELDDLLVCCSIEGWLAREQDVHDHSD